MLARDPIKTTNPFGALNSRSRSASSSASKPITPTTTPGGGADEKKKRKKKKKSKAVSDTQSLGSSSVEEPVTDTDSVEPEPLPLVKRLEVAASHADLHAALVGLVGWSRLYLNTDTIMAFFHCDALPLLFVNVLTCRSIKNDAIFDHLTTLLANCLHVERDGKICTSNTRVATAVVGALRAVMGNDSSGFESEDAAASVENVAAHLSKIVFQYRMSLNGVNVDSALSKEVFDIETQLAAVASKDSAVKGETIRESFQRRDIRSDALVLHELRLKKVAQLQGESERKTPVADNGLLTYALHGPEDEIQVDEQQVQEAKAQLDKLTADKAAKLALLEDKRTSQEERLASLKGQRDELEAKLRVLNESIQGVEAEREELNVQTTAIHEAFEQKTCRFNEEHNQILQAHRRKERRELIQNEFTKLSEAIASISKKEVHSASDIQTTAVRQHLESALRYFDSELPCVKFMKNRVDETQTAMLKLTQEANEHDALGLHAEAEEMHDKANAMRAHLDEDTQCVAALMKRDLEIVTAMEAIFADSQFKDSLDQLDSHLKKEAQRHIEYVRELHAEPKTKENEPNGCTKTVDGDVSTATAHRNSDISRHSLG